MAFASSAPPLGPGGAGLRLDAAARGEEHPTRGPALRHRGAGGRPAATGVNVG